MAAYVELLRKSNLHCLITRKALKTGSRADEMIFASLIDNKQQKLKLIVCSDKSDTVTMWSISLDERAFQTNARLLDISELGQTMTFLAERIQESDFVLAKATATAKDHSAESTPISVTFTNAKNKHSITLELHEQSDAEEKATDLSKILQHVYKRNEELTAEVARQQVRIRELTSKTSYSMDDNSNARKSDDSKNASTKIQERTQRSLINPSSKRRKAAKGVNYGSDDSD